MPPSSDQDERRSGRATRPDEVPARMAPPVLDVVLATDWVSPSIVRDRVRAWLTAHRWSPSGNEDLVLAVNEAVTNSLEHGYGLRTEDVGALPSPARPPVEVHGEITATGHGDRRVRFTIRDRGRWRVPHEDATRGNGIRLMRACADEVVIDHDDHGTTVSIVSRPVPPVPRDGP